VTAVFRICGKKYSPKDPSGAALSSEGRWHIKGERVLYFSNSLATCILELKANGVSYNTIRNSHHYCEAFLPPDGSMEIAPTSLYESGWQRSKAGTQAFGSQWMRDNRSLILKVKSAVLAVEENYLINTNHPQFPLIKFSEPKPTELDPRLA
jgi:RES domain-containing protein